MYKKLLVLATITMCAAQPQGNVMNSTTDCFNFTPIKPYSKLLVQPSHLKSHDGIDLAYYPFIAQQPKATIIFYHGGALWSCGVYHHMAQELAQKHNITTYLFDIRGHGNSAGERGDAPTAEDVYKDVDTAVAFVKKQNPDLPIYLAGHSSGAGLILNYDKFKNHEPKNLSKNRGEGAAVSSGSNHDSFVKGYLLLTPYLGDPETIRKDQKLVSSVRSWIFALQGITGWNLFDHTAVVFFDYPEWLKKQDEHVLGYYTTAMAKATSPYQVQGIFEQLTTPFALWVGDKDEQFYPDKIVACADHAQKVSQKSVNIVKGATHLTTVLDAPKLFDEAITMMGK